MNRRAFLQLAGLVAAASALDTLPAAASGRASATSAEIARGVGSGASPVVTRLSVTEPGLYQVSGRVRLQESLVQIGGITNSQTISWAANARTSAQMASFTSFEQVGAAGQLPAIEIVGGVLEDVSVMRLDLA